MADRLPPPCTPHHRPPLQPPPPPTRPSPPKPPPVCIAVCALMPPFTPLPPHTIRSAAETWLPDLAWAAEQLKRRRVSSSSSHVSINGASRHPAQQQPQLRVTWRRLHAMGPRHLLEHQVALGALPSITATQWPIDYGADATFNGVSPVLVVPGFSSPQPYPMLLLQQAPPAWG